MCYTVECALMKIPGIESDDVQQAIVVSSVRARPGAVRAAAIEHTTTVKIEHQHD